MKVGDIVSVEPAPVPGIKRIDEVERSVRESLAKEVQRRLRGQVDFGLELNDAQRAQAIRVRARGNRLVIDEASSARVMRDQQQGTDPTASDNINQLFEPSRGIPRMDVSRDGRPRLVFRSVQASRMFEEQNKKIRDDRVASTVTDAVREGIVDAYETALSDVNRRHPEDQ